MTGIPLTTDCSAEWGYAVGYSSGGWCTRISAALHGVLVGVAIATITGQMVWCYALGAGTVGTIGKFDAGMHVMGPLGIMHCSFRWP